jgi:hypothetical protein
MACAPPTSAARLPSVLTLPSSAALQTVSVQMPSATSSR